jgi:DNA-binding Xre family transcriptional regulator
MISPSDIHLSTLPWVPLKATNGFPEDPAIYFAIDDQGQVQYIGRSVNPVQRWANHHRCDQLNEIGGIRIAYLFIDSIDLLPVIEEALIDWFAPSLNATPVPRSPASLLTTGGKVSWLLRETMARRKITNKSLAEKLGKHPVSIARLKAQDTLPEIGSAAIEEIRVAITDLSKKSFGACTFSELIGLEEDAK